MPIKGTALTIQYVAWDTAANAGKTADASNHTLRGVGDGTEYTPAASPAAVDDTNLPGVYKVAIAAAENAYDVVTLGGISSSTGVVLIPISWVNQEPVAIRKNVAYSNFTFPMISSADSVTRVSGATVTLTRSIDGAAFAAAANSVSEIGTTGVYKVNLAASDLNGAVITLLATATGCDDQLIEILTQP